MGQITSMTGYGAGSAEGEGLKVRAVLRSVNGRFLDLSLRCPGSLQELEPRIREAVGARLSRGKVNGTIDVEEVVERSGLPQLDAEVAAQYVHELRRLGELAGADADSAVPLEVLARMPGLFHTDTPSPDPEALAGLVMTALEAALDEMEQMRRTEGETLVRDLRERLQLIGAATDRVDALAAGARDEIRRRLREKVDGLLETRQIDDDRLAMEVVLIAERGDITEEIVRLRSHLEQFGDTLDKGGDVGRRLNFLLQEMHREINTISSKSAAGEIIHLTVDVKEEIERLREQVQNLA